MLVPPLVEFKVHVDRQRCKVAHRVDHCVPVFQEQVEITSGLPVVPVRSEEAKEPPESLRLASAEEGRKDLENGSQVLVERGSKTFQVTDKLHLTLRTTWLVTMTEWFFIGNRFSSVANACQSDGRAAARHPLAGYTVRRP